MKAVAVFRSGDDDVVVVPAGLRAVGVLLEPASIIEKGIAQAYEIQRRFPIWRPRRAAVLGAGTVGLLATTGLHLRGMDVHTFANTRRPYLNADLLEAIGAHYHSVAERPFTGSGADVGPFDIIFEATGYAPIAFDALAELGKNGVLVLSSVTGGKHEITVDADRLNLDFVLGNKVMVGTVNASREHFELGVSDFARAEMTWPGWLGRLLTHPVKGLESYEALLHTLNDGKDVIKVFCEVWA